MQKKLEVLPHASAKIKNDLTEAGYEVDEDFGPASMYYWTIKWDKEDDGYDFI